MVLFCAHINMPFPPISAVQKSKVENPCLSQFVIHSEPEQIQNGSFIFLVYPQD